MKQKCYKLYTHRADLIYVKKEIIREATFNFVIKENVWLPEDDTLFFSDLGEIASGQK